MLYIKLFIEREKNTGQSAPECPFKLFAHMRWTDRQTNGQKERLLLPTSGSIII